MKCFTKRLNVIIGFSFWICSGSELKVNAPCVLNDLFPASFFDFGTISLFPYRLVVPKKIEKSYAISLRHQRMPSNYKTSLTSD